uniref:Uncharacterized protein n=1 Tax=Phenylobacterium glaciei TaxID=2803784 RepID=A0A974S9U3_9CAUL|nr:hypothetical protein JKL49_13515 [Phenylobacterium glaciei]
MTSLIHDHVNVFPTFHDYEAPFIALMHDLPKGGLMVARDHSAVHKIAAETDAHVVWYDTVPCDGWFSEDVAYGETTSFKLVRPDGSASRSPPPCWAPTTSRTSSGFRPSCWSVIW